MIFCSLSNEAVLYKSIPRLSFELLVVKRLNIGRKLKQSPISPGFEKKRTGNLRRTAALLSVLLVSGALLYFFMVPWLAEQVATVVSKKTERQLGDTVFEAMKSAQTEDTMATRVLNEFFTALAIETDYSIRITVVKDEMVNAFALPGGQLVVYTGLLENMETYPELAALLSHEFIHVEKSMPRVLFSGLWAQIYL